jgi:hypothetical protein
VNIKFLPEADVSSHTACMVYDDQASGEEGFREFPFPLTLRYNDGLIYLPPNRQVAREYHVPFYISQLFIVNSLTPTQLAENSFVPFVYTAFSESTTTTALISCGDDFQLGFPIGAPEIWILNSSWDGN